MAQKLSDEQQNLFYNDIKAGAESGWDFSGRWLIPVNENSELNLLNISTQFIIPVDLNAFLQQNGRLLSEFHTRLGNSAVSFKTLVRTPSEILSSELVEYVPIYLVQIERQLQLV